MRPAASANPSPLDTANRRVDDGNAPLLALRASDRKCDDHHQEIALKKSFDQLELPNSAWFESGFIGQTSPFLPRRPRRLSELYFNPFADYSHVGRADGTGRDDLSRYSTRGGVAAQTAAPACRR